MWKCSMHTAHESDYSYLIQYLMVWFDAQLCVPSYLVPKNHFSHCNHTCERVFIVLYDSVAFSLSACSINLTKTVSSTNFKRIKNQHKWSESGSKLPIRFSNHFQTWCSYGLFWVPRFFSVKVKRTKLCNFCSTLYLKVYLVIVIFFSAVYQYNRRYLMFTPSQIDYPVYSFSASMHTLQDNAFPLKRR